MIMGLRNQKYSSSAFNVSTSEASVSSLWVTGWDFVVDGAIEPLGVLVVGADPWLLLLLALPCVFTMKSSDGEGFCSILALFFILFLYDFSIMVKVNLIFFEF